MTGTEGACNRVTEDTSGEFIQRRGCPMGIEFLMVVGTICTVLMFILMLIDYVEKHKK